MWREGLIPTRGMSSSNNLSKALMLLPVLISIFSVQSFSQDAEARPVMQMEMSLSEIQLGPMDVFICTINLHNRGSSIAQFVWVNITLPEEISYLSDNAGMERGIRKNGTNWLFVSLNIGDHSFDVRLQIRPRVKDGDVLTISARLEYYDVHLMPMTSESEASIRIHLPKSRAQDSSSLDPVFPLESVSKTPDLKLGNSTENIPAVAGNVGNTLTNEDEDKEPRSIPSQLTADTGILSNTEPMPDNMNNPSDKDVLIMANPQRPNSEDLHVITLDEGEGEREHNNDSYIDYELGDMLDQTAENNRNENQPMLFSNIISNNKVYSRGDVLSFTIFINNTGSEQATHVLVRLTIPSTLDFLRDTAVNAGGRYIGNMTYLFNHLAPGDHEFMIYFLFHGEEEDADVEIWAYFSYRDREGEYMGEVTHRASCTIVSEPKKPADIQTMIAILSIGMLSLLALSTSKLGKHTFLPLMLLYSRLKKREVLNHEARDMILSYIRNNPGEHFNSIKVKLDLRNGTLAHHLHILERERVIKSVRYGKYRRFFPAGMMVSSQAYPTQLEQEIIEIVRSRPGINQKTIASIVGKSKSTVNYHISKLKKAGRIRTEKTGLELRHYVAGTE